MKRHPLCDECGVPEPARPEIDRIGADMLEYGWDRRYPSVWYQNRCLAGMTREIAAKETKTPTRRIKFKGTMEQARAFIMRSELARRHLTPEQQKVMADARKVRIADLREKGESIRSIADKEKVSKATVEKDLKASGVQGWTPDGQVVGKDGKKYAAIADDNRCGKCKRTFPTTRTSVKDCQACKRLKEEAAAAKKGRTEPGTHEPSRRGKPTGAAAYDWRRFNSVFGQLMREVDVMERTFGLRSSPGGDQVRAGLKEWKNKDLVNWYRQISGTEAKATR